MPKSQSAANGPLVSCIMPTFGRPDYVAESIQMFLRQDYAAKELIVLNDCPGQILCGEFPNVRIINSPERWHSLGEKRNAAIEMSRGLYLAVWDDDDIYFPWRLSYSMRRIHELGEPQIYCPATYWAYWGDENLHENQAVMDWIYHPQVVFTKKLWSTLGGYPPQTLSEDTAFFTKAIEHLGIDWPRDEIAAHDRVMIMRGTSKYRHTSIDGGRAEPDTRPGAIRLETQPVNDDCLRRCADDLIAKRAMAVSKSAT